MNIDFDCYDVVLNRPKAAAYRAPSAPMSCYAVESVLDEIAQKLDMDPIDLRLKNAVKEGDSSVYGPTFGPIGFVECLEATRDHPNMKAKLGPNQARGIAAGFWPTLAARPAFRSTSPMTAMSWYPWARPISAAAAPACA